MKLQENSSIIIIELVAIQNAGSYFGSCKKMSPQNGGFIRETELVPFRFCNLLRRCLVTLSTQHKPNKHSQMRNISSNNCAHCNVPFVLAQLQSFSTINRLIPQIFLLYRISGVDDVISISNDARATPGKSPCCDAFRGHGY